MQADDIQALNPELLRGVTPPDSHNYVLNLPPNSKELFTRNITLARIENPAVASRPVQTARSNSRQYSHSRSQASRQAAPATPKAGAKPKTYAKGSQKSSSGAVYTKKGKTPEAKEAAPAAVHASLFGGVAAAPKHGAANKASGPTQSAANGKAKGKTTTAKAADKKGDTAGKTAAKTKTAKKSGAPAKSKDKYSKGKSPALLVSEAR